MARPFPGEEQVTRSPEERFKQHQEGKKAAGYVRKHGLRLRPEFYERLNPMTRSDAAAEEVALARLLRRQGYPTWQN